MKSLVVAGLILLVTLVGCSVQFRVKETNQTDLGSHHVVVKPGSTFTTSSSSTGGESAIYQYTCGDTSIEIRNEELIVNNARYGQLPPGADVLVDHGEVFVAGEKRAGTPVSPERIMEAAIVKETTKELNGHLVTVRPGASFTSATQLFGKHTLTVGNTKVVIKKDELFVDGVAFGMLKPGDSILVEHGAVTVSGQPREPRK